MKRSAGGSRGKGRRCGGGRCAAGYRQCTRGARAPRGWTRTGAEPPGGGRLPLVEEQPAQRPAAPAARERGEGSAAGPGDAGASGWVTTQQAARALAISPRTVRWHIDQGNLEAKPQGEGVKRAWHISIDSLQAFRDSRQHAAQSSEDYREILKGADIVAEGRGSAIRELADRLVEEAGKASEFRVRLELTERAESTLRAELEEERRRREGAERERDELAAKLTALEDAREAPQTAAEDAGGAERARPPKALRRPQSVARGSVGGSGSSDLGAHRETANLTYRFFPSPAVGEGKNPGDR